MAESFVDTFKTELIKDRVWHSNQQLELAVVEWVAWYNDVRLHSSLENRPPAEIEATFTAAVKNGVLDQPNPAKTTPNQSADESSQLVSLTR